MNKLLLNVGSGACHIKGFTNIDAERSHNPDLVLDALDLDSIYVDNGVDGIIANHFFEHLSFPDDADKFLKVAYKVLKPGGVLRLVVPDLALVANAYARGDDLSFIYGSSHKGFYKHANSRAEKFHYFMHAWSHSMVYDADLLKTMMYEAGFPAPAQMPFGVSQMPELCNLDRYESESCVVEGVT